MKAPMLSALAFVFGISTVGIPASPTFVAEDIIAQGILVPHPWLAIGFVVVAALNAIGMLRHFGRVFLGATAHSARSPAARESGWPRFAVIVLLAGLAPQLTVPCEDLPIRQDRPVMGCSWIDPFLTQ